MDIPQVVYIIKKWGLSGREEINNMPKMARRYAISVYAINDIPIREDGRKKMYQTSKYKIPKNGAYYVHHDCHKNHKARENVAVP